jgi:hypothetical protein
VSARPPAFRWPFVTVVAAMLVIVAVPTALDAADQIVGPVVGRAAVGVADAARLQVPGHALVSRTRHLGRSAVPAPAASLRRVASAGQVRRPARPVGQAGLVTLAVAGALAVCRRRRHRSPVPPRQRGPDGCRAPPQASFACRMSAAALALGCVSGRDQGGTSCPSLPMT